MPTAVVFDEAINNIGSGLINLATDTIKVALFNDTITPSQLSGSAKRRERERAEAERGLVLQKRMRPALMPD